MSAQVGKYAANVLLKKHMKQYSSKKVETGADPYFAMVEDPRRPGKLKKVKKQVPAYIPEHDAEILASVRRKAYRLDMCLFNFLGIRFGWEAVIGLIPLAGDAIGVFFALLVVQKCMKIDGGLSKGVQMQMMLNIAMDFVVGLVPFLGDLADAAFKCNTRNLRLLERTLDKKYRPQRDDRDFVGVDKEKRRRNRQSGIYTSNDPPPATAFEEFSDDELRDQHDLANNVQQPQATQTTGQQQRRSGWFGSKKQPPPPGNAPPPSRPHQGATIQQVVPSQQETGSVRR